MDNKKYRSFTRSFENYSDIDKYIEEKSTSYQDYDLFDFKVVYRGSTASWPYLVTVVLKKVESNNK